MFLSDISIKRPVMITMVMSALLLFGVIAYLALPLNLMPDAKIPYITITTIYPGASPDQVESQITKKIEDEVGAVSLIKSIQSYSLNSVSITLLEFDLEKDPDVASQEVKDCIDATINDLPDAAETPLVNKVDITAAPVMTLVLKGQIESTELNHLAENQVKERLSRIKGVGSVNVLGGVDREILVAFDSKTVYENSLNLSQVAGILAYANVDMPGGNFQNESEDYAVSLRGQIQSAEDLGGIMIPGSAGMRKLDQLAVIEPTAQDVKQRVSFFSREGGTAGETVLLSIVKSSEGNPVAIAREVASLLPELQQSLPSGVELSIASDDSEFIENTVNDTLGNIILGIIFTAAILFFFLHDFRSTLIVAISMPLSIIPTFIILKTMGITINMMSLMGLSTSVGVLVMNSVVVLENIFRHKRMGVDRKTAASKGTSEVAVTIIASTLTNIAVFLPIGTMGGMVGLTLKDFALTVVVSTIFSLLISFTLTPMLASLLIPEGEQKKGKISRRIESFFSSLERGYARTLSAILTNKKRSGVLVGSVLFLFILAIFSLSRTPFEFTPAMDSGAVRLEVELPQDASLDQTEALVGKIEDVMVSYEEVDSYIITLGELSSLDSGTNLAAIDLSLVDAGLRRSSRSVASSLSGDLAEIANAVIRVTAVDGFSLMGSYPINFYLQADDDAVLHAGAEGLYRRLMEIDGLSSINMSLKSGKPEIILQPNRQKVAEAGITVQDLALSMRAAIEGLTLTQLKNGTREYDIRVALMDSDISSFEQIRTIPVSTPAGIYPLSHFADISMEEGVNKLLRTDKSGSVNFTSGIEEGFVLGDLTVEIENAFEQMDDSELSLKWSGSAEMMNETIRSMAFAFGIAILLTYMLLAAVLEKFGQPLLILSTVPLSLIGVAAIFLLTGMTLNMVSMMAIIMLVGMVVNNAILILDYTNQLRREGMNVHDALIKACPVKLQPILMANIATMLGLMPMALGIGKSAAEMRQPMGVVSIGGLMAATLLTLFFIPAVENIVESKKEKADHIKALKDQI